MENFMALTGESAHDQENALEELSLWRSTEPSGEIEEHAAEVTVDGATPQLPDDEGLLLTPNTSALSVRMLS